MAKRKSRSRRGDVNVRLATDMDPGLLADLEDEMRREGERQKSYMIRVLLREALDARAGVRNLGDLYEEEKC